MWCIYISLSWRYHSVNINVAVQTDHGLFVPVIRVSCVATTKSSHYWSCYILVVLWLVFVLQDADKKGLASIADEVKQLAQRARDNSLKPEDYEVWTAIYLGMYWIVSFLNNWHYALQGGTFTVSNLGGPFGTKQFCAIVNPPQSAILAIGSGSMFPEFLHWSYPTPLLLFSFRFETTSWSCARHYSYIK